MSPVALPAEAGPEARAVHLIINVGAHPRSTVLSSLVQSLPPPLMALAMLPLESKQEA